MEFVKHKIFLAVLVIFVCACSSPRGELVSPPEGLEQAAKEFLAAKKYNYKLLGLSVRKYPNDVFLVSADAEYTKEDSSKKINIQLIAEKGYRDGALYWQVTDASAYKLKTLGIQPD